MEWEALSDWESYRKSGLKRELRVSYSSDNGVIVNDLKSGVRFSLHGNYSPHPIDLLRKKCEENYSTTLGIQDCKILATEAWDRELNRAYKDLGGNSNLALKETQLAWMNFRDKKIELLRKKYAAYEGSIWGIVFLGHVENITKEQALWLSSIQWE